MESKRLGLCHKSLFVVPNHLTEQWSGEFLRLYPSANILVATKKDFEPKNRKKFCARIATGEYDAVIIGHSQFEKIPVSMERQQRLLAEQIFEVEEGLRELKSQRAERFTIKSLERTKRGLEAKLKKLQDSSRKDDVVTFEQLGVDRLYVDEAHNYKNLFLYTKMRNVAGLSATDAQKSSDMLLKCRYIDEITDSRGVVFATGTPVSNSMTELYTMMRYLQHDAIRGKGLAHFDCWASTFGEAADAPAQRRHVGQFALALLPHRDGRVRTHINDRFALNQRFLHCQMLRAVRRRIQIRHRADGRISAMRARRAAGRNGLLIRKSRLTQMHMHIHKAGKKGKSTAIKHFLCRKGKLFPTGDNDAVFNCHIGLLPLALFQDRTVLEQHSHVQPSCRFGLSVQL